MDERQKADALSRYLDALLSGEGDVRTAAVDEEIQALGKLGQSLATVELKPGPAHQAAVERLLQRKVPQGSKGLCRIFGKRRPTLRTGGATMSHAILGIPLRWFLVLVTTLAGGGLVALAAARGGLIPTDVLKPDTPTPKLALEVTTSRVTPAHALPVTGVETIAVEMPTALASVPAEVMTTTEPVTPTIALTSTKPGRAGLAFHPEHLNAGGKCRDVYLASGSLKNHGPDVATKVVISHEVVSDAEWVDRVEVEPSEPEDLGTAKPLRFTVSVYVTGTRSLESKGALIEVQLFVAGEGDEPEERLAEATFTVRIQCQDDQPEEPTRSGLAFHPERLNAGGKCREVYSSSGSLKNHGPARAGPVQINHEIVDGDEWVDHVEVTPPSWEQLGTDKPERFTVYVHVNGVWPLAGKGNTIEVRLFVDHGESDAEATFIVRNQCQPEKPDKSEKPDKPGKPEKLDKPGKPDEPGEPGKPEKPDKPEKPGGSKKNR